MSEVIQSFDYDINSDQFTQMLPCVLMQPCSLLTIQNIEIKVTKFEKKEGGIF